MTIVAEILDAMSGITKPQRKFVLTLFAAMLVTGRRINFLNLSRHGSVDEKTFRRHFQKPFDFASFNQLAIAKGNCQLKEMAMHHSKSCDTICR